MKLSDLVITEAEELAAAESGQKTIELKDVVQYFPNTYQKAVKTLRDAGRLTFGGELLFEKGGEYGPGMERATAEAEEAVRKDEIEITVDMDGTVADKDHHADFTFDAPINDAQETYVGYDITSNKLLIGYDVWISDEEFNEAWDREFEEEFGEDFDDENEDHEKIFNHAWKQFTGRNGGGKMFYGALVDVNDDYHAEVEDMFWSGGFHKGARPEREEASPIAHLAGGNASLQKKIEDRSKKKRSQTVIRHGRKVVDLI
jgi:hypothetical protein